MSAGTLLVSGSLTASSVTVSNAGSTFGGTGTVKDVTVQSGAILQGGDGVLPTGALTSGGNVALLDGSVIRLMLGAGSTHSSLVRTGGAWSFDLDQAFRFDIAGASHGTFDNIISGLAGTEAGLSTIANWTITTPGLIGTFAYDNAGGVDLHVTSIPEPGAMVMLLAALPLLGLQRRRART